MEKKQSLVADISSQTSKSTCKTSEEVNGKQKVLQKLSTFPPKIMRKAQSLNQTSTENKSILHNLRTYSHPNPPFFIETEKKAVLTRSVAIDESNIEPTTSTANISRDIDVKVKKFASDVRSHHSFKSFFVKHFEKMHNKMSKRPLSASLSFNLDERGRNQLLHRSALISQHESIPHLPVNLGYLRSARQNFHCYHCQLLQELESETLEKAVASNNAQSVKITRQSWDFIQNFNINDTIKTAYYYSQSSSKSLGNDNHISDK
ncbi:unnamed protein product [Thelazia callipaeda]|uniref:Uncharacterized protein n=1 Tax=Thelazia callipaeda TaxID=103827 RepID=A0A0N5D5G1_THECL|nr:unnamed protein product [Thelazia callipaeda]